MAKTIKYCVFLLLFQTVALAQNISLWEQFNGKYDFTFIGNTLNPEENSNMVTESIQTSSSASLNLSSDDVIEKAYLYWAGCGPGDFEVQLNNTVITPQRIFQHLRTTNGVDFEYFSAFTDITALVQSTGNGTYTLSDLDLNAWISYYFQNRTNFGGWALIVVYKNNNLPLNQLNVYDGLQAVPNAITINLSSLNVVDNQNAKIGFLAWEGDENIAVNETLRINGNVLGNPPLNPFNNAFNGTDSLTNNDQLYNMDLDVYDIQNNIAVGDTSAQIQLTSGQDFVMVNAIVTKLNSQLPDATILIDDVAVRCNSTDVIVHYTVRNDQGTKALPADVPVAVYLNAVLLTTTQTQNHIEIGDSEDGTIQLQLPEGVVSPFTIQFVIDDDGTGQGTVTESNETNNKALEEVSLTQSPPIKSLPELSSCNEGLTSGTFDLSGYETMIKQNPADLVTFYTSNDDLLNNTNPITDITQFHADVTPLPIFVKVDNGSCFQAASFILKTIKCKPTVYNYVSSNNDGINDTFTIKGLRDVFTNFSLKIYNRWGHLVWMGNNNTPNWDGIATEGLIANPEAITDGTYFYSLDLNDPDYPEPLCGYLFVKQ